MSARIMYITGGVVLAAGLIWQLDCRTFPVIGQQSQPKVVYFKGNSVASSQGLVTEASLSQAISNIGSELVVVSSWIGVIDEWHDGDIAVLIVDDMSISIAESAWIHEKYRGNAMAVIGLDVSGPDLAVLVNDPAAAEHLASNRAFPCGESFSAVQLAITGTPFALTEIAPEENAVTASDSLEITTPERLAVSFTASEDKICFQREFDRLVREVKLLAETFGDPEEVNAYHGR